MLRIIGMKVKQAAELLDCSTSTVYRMFKEGKLWGHSLLGGIRISEESVEAVLNPPKPVRKKTEKKRPGRLLLRGRGELR